MIDATVSPRADWKQVASRRLLEYSIKHSGRRRTALVYVPRHAKRGALPLVLVFHSGASSPEAVARASAMHRIGERDGFIVAYPAGTPGLSGLSWVPGGRPDARIIGDASFIRGLIHDLQQRFDVDPARVFAAGFSIGGSLVYELASVAADQIAAIAVVAGTMTNHYPAPPRPVPLIHIHGTKDRSVPLEGGRGASTARKNQWLSVQTTVDRWREINRCASEPDIVRSALHGVTGFQYRGAGDVELWIVEGGGHSWPGGSRSIAKAADAALAAKSFSASEKIWRFFCAHPNSQQAAKPSRPRTF